MAVTVFDNVLYEFIRWLSTPKADSCPARLSIFTVSNVETLRP